jgi:hypothetical protein
MVWSQKKIDVSQTVVSGGSPGGPQAVSKKKKHCKNVPETERMRGVTLTTHPI